jgi:hypothetical protein
MHIRNWVASAKIRLDEKRKARAALEAADCPAAQHVADCTAAAAQESRAATGGAGLRKRSGKTKKT